MGRQSCCNISTCFWHRVWGNSIKGGGKKAQPMMMPLKIPVWCTVPWLKLLPQTFRHSCYIYDLWGRGSWGKRGRKKKVFCPGRSAAAGLLHKIRNRGQTNKLQLYLENWARVTRLDLDSVNDCKRKGGVRCEYQWLQTRRAQLLGFLSLFDFFPQRIQNNTLQIRNQISGCKKNSRDKYKPSGTPLRLLELFQGTN